ncbi:MAG: putative DNA-binding transcriptional regulator [Akkermansiaceae bacterium]|nr:putative DNA-binding transcriptional regulator [Akkermansiaceae bacterium]
MQVELFAAPPRKGEQARRKLLLAGLKFFGDKGFEDASVREIAGAAGKNVASIAYYFGGKEQLYHAVIEGIVTYLGTLFYEVAGEARSFVEQGRKDPAVAVQIMKRILRGFLMEHLEREEIGKIRHLMMREQGDPTEAFEILYDKVLQPQHDLFAQVLAIATGEDPKSPLLILRAHAFFGHVIGFTVARHTVLRRLGVKRLTPEHGELIAFLIDQHVDFISAGLLSSKAQDR